MYLKALEIQGFKSFPDKTRLTFEKEITAIVGPNGSGKSNISDAILWVMGEQSSKTLRGGKMQDVIFGGTAKRGAMGFAQVSLILDNSGDIFDIDAEEVAITRRYYRSGESEYYINRDQVRLRDVNELLMDTGLGRDGYSIIGQGRIAEIVNGKSAERREVLEEAAGISRFRYRKEEAERRLARTDENLLRVNDKIDELELQVGPLKQQAEVAKRYLSLRDELRVEEVSAWMDALDRLREQPKWIVGFSDVTMLHLALGRLGVESLHATMPGKFRFGRDETPEAIVSDEALRSALLGLRQRIDTDPHPLNSPGTARGRLTGGNLAIVCSSLGTPEEPDFDAPTVLFIEEVGEHMYRLDRMMQQLARSGKLAKCKAILVGHFSDMAGQKHFGITDPYDIVAQYVRPLGIPVVFGLPAGHEDPNVALYMGREVTVTVGETGAAIEF